MVQKLLPVIRRQDHDGVAPTPHRPKLAEQRVECRVGSGDIVVVGGEIRTKVARRARQQPSGDRYLRRDRLGRTSDAEHAGRQRWRRVRAVRLHEMDPREQRTPAVAVASRVDRVGNEPLAPGEVRARVETKPIESLREAERLDQERIGREPVRLIAAGAQRFRQRRHRRGQYVSGDRSGGEMPGHRFGKRYRRGDRLVRARILAGHDRRDRRLRVRRLRNRVGEPGAAASEGIDGRRRELVVTVRRQVIGAQRVDRHEHDVGTTRRGQRQFVDPRAGRKPDDGDRGDQPRGNAKNRQETLHSVKPRAPRPLIPFRRLHDRCGSDTHAFRLVDGRVCKIRSVAPASPAVVYSQWSVTKQR